MGVNHEDFARHVNYLAALGRLVVPRAFEFVGRPLLFLGHHPFDAEELASLLPEQVEWYLYEEMTEGLVPGTVVLGHEDFSKEELRAVF